jgi:TP901 family phage tail tape measure protein
MSIQVPVTQVGLEASIQAAAQKAGRNLKIDLGVSSRAIGSLSQPLGKITGQADQFTKSMEASNARVIAFGASVGVLAAVSQGFKSIITTTIQVEKSLAAINSVLGANTAKLNQFKDDIFSVARETGNSFETVSEAALELSRQGLKADEVLRRLKDSMILSRLSGLSAAASVEGLTAAVNSFSKSGITTSEVLNKISKTAASFAVSERDIIEGLKRSASVADQAGVSINELGAIITAVQQKTARGGAVIGNSFKTIFTRIRNQESLQALQDLGIAVTDIEGNLLPATRLIENLANKMEDLTAQQKQAVTVKIAGGFQIAPFLAILDDMTSKTSIFQKATETMANASGEAYARNAVLNQTMDAAINSSIVSLKELANTLGEIGVTDNLQNILSFFNSFITSVKDVLQGEGLGSDMAKGIVKGISAVLSGPGLLIFGAIITKLTINFAQFGVQALKTFFNIGAAAREIGSIQTTIASTLLNNKSIQTQILALEGNRVAQAQFFSTALNTQLATMERMRSIAASIAPVVYGATTGSRRPRAAEGYMPTVMAEAGDIKKGVGGARSSDRPVVIPNFAFGGGKTGTMVAHTGEYIVPNFASGGSAIFNRDMVKTMGLPEGARKIGAAGGFIPNFARKVTINNASTAEEFDRLYATGQYKQAAKIDSERTVSEKFSQLRIDAAKRAVAGGKKGLSNLKLNANDIGGLGLVSVSGFGYSDSASTYTSALSKDEKKSLEQNFGENFSSVSISNIQTRNLKALDQSQKESGQKDFRARVKRLFTEPLLLLAQDMMPGVFKNNDLQERKSLINDPKKDPYIFSDSVLGGIFESAISLSTAATKNIRAFSANDQNAPFDFEERKGEGASDAFREAFKFNSIYKADAKKTGDDSTLRTLIGKSLRDDQVMKRFASKGIVSASPKAVSKASGYIPNFADPLQDAVIREMSAGVPASQIYIDQNSSLKGPMNPSGLMVANRRDEPAGGFQGIARARKEGADARMYGAANGFVPNFANLTMGDIGSTAKVLASSLTELNDKIKQLNKAVADNEISYERASVELNGFINKIKVPAKTKLKTVKAAEGQLTQPEKSQEKGPRDMLGTIFAVQAGLSLLTGATSDATSGFGKIANQLAGSLGTITSVVFAMQGLKTATAGATTGAMGFASKAVGVLGPLAIGITAGVQGLKLFNSFIVESSKKSAVSLDRMSAVADKLSAKLSDEDKLATKEVISETIGKSTVTSVANSVATALGGQEAVNAFNAIFFPEKGVQSKTTYTNQNVVLEQNVSADQLRQAQEKFMSSFVESRMKTPEYQGKTTKEVANIALKRFEGITGLGAGKDMTLINQATLDALESQVIVSGQISEKYKDVLTTSQQQIAVEQINLDVAKSQLKNALDLATIRNRGLDSLDKQVIRAKILNNLSAEQKANLDLEIAKRDEGRKLADDTKGAIQSQIDKLKGAAVAQGKVVEFEGQLLKLTDKDLQNRQLVEQILLGIGDVMVENTLLTKAELEAQKVLLNKLFGESSARQKNLDLAKEAEASATRLNTSISNIAATMKAASSYNLFTASMSSDRAIQARNLEINRLEESKAGRSDADIREIERQIANKRLQITQEEIDKRNIEASSQARSIYSSSFPSDTSEYDRQIQLAKINNLDDALIDIGKLIKESGKDNPNTQAFINAEAELKKLKETTEFQNKSALELATQQADMAGKTKAVNDALTIFSNSLEEIPQKLADLSLERGATTSGRRLREMDYEKATLSEMDKMREGGVTPEEIAAYQRERSVKSIGQKFSEAFSETEFDRMNRFSDTLVSGAEKFRDTMIDGMATAIEQGGDVGDVLRGAALDFAREMTRMNMRNLFSSFIPSPVLGFASGGKITGGSGTKDDVPAMLMSGEYVMNKKSVSKYGTAFMEALNNGSVSGYAKGGSVIRDRGLGSDVIGNDAARQRGKGGFQMPGYYGSGAITGKKDLLAFARQAYTSGEGDVIRGGDDFASIDLTPESVRLTNFGRKQGPMAAAVRESKQQAFGLYVQQIEAEQRAKEEEKAKKKEFRRSLLMAGITMVAGAGLKYAGNVIGTGFQQGMSETGTFMGGVKGIGEKVGNVGSSLGSLFSGDFKAASQFSNMATTNFKAGVPKASVVGGVTNASFGSGSFSGKNVGNLGSSGYTGGSGGFSIPSLPFDYPSGNTNSSSFKFGVSQYDMAQDSLQRAFERGLGIEDLSILLPTLNGYATGGRIPQTSGIDTVPAMLSGGEFIMNAGATQRIGANNLNALNSGASTTMDSSENNEELIRKLDELIQITKESSKPVTVNVSSQQSQSGGNNESSDSQQKDQNLSRKIKEAVVRVLQEEKRLGGVLRRA